MANLRPIARFIFEQALADCNIERAMARHVHVEDANLHLGTERINLSRLRRIRIIAVGKAAGEMLRAFLEQLPPSLECNVAGILVAPESPPEVPQAFQYFAGGHPFPNEASFAAARAALAMLHSLPKEAAAQTLCLFLISGGASAMMELPLDPGITLLDTIGLHRTLVASGASITEINCIRKHFSAVKGGRLALAARDARCHSLLVADVPSGHEDALGSGPTLPDSSTVAKCREILERYALLPQCSAAVRDFFESPALPETPKPLELHTLATTLLDADDLADAAARRAEALGWTAIIDNTCDDWEYRDAAQYLLDRLRTLRQQYLRVCLISSGEVTVRLPESTAGDERVGVGGRNQQFVLYSATLLQPEDAPIAILSAGSDGIDGNSPAAGAFIDEMTIARPTHQDVAAQARALQALAGFDAYPLLAEWGAIIMTGRSGNNLRDLRVLLGTADV